LRDGFEVGCLEGFTVGVVGRLEGFAEGLLVGFVEGDRVGVQVEGGPEGITVGGFVHFIAGNTSCEFVTTDTW